MSIIPLNFQFSQNNLQDYVDCPRRFQLRHLERREWPALQSEPVLEMEHKADLGRRFHEMVQQAQSGIPSERISETIKDTELAEWWQAYQQSTILADLPESRKAEYTLSAAFMGFRLVAKYDLLASAPGQKAVIVDWKTSGKPLPRRYLAARLQTRVYPFLLAQAGARLNSGIPIPPDRIEMIYWFTGDPHNPVHFQYSLQQYQEDRDYLAALLNELSGRPADSFLKTPDEKKCRFCVYRSLCNRGERAGSWEEAEDDLQAQAQVDVDFEQIGEIEF